MHQERGHVFIKNILQLIRRGFPTSRLWDMLPTKDAVQFCFPTMSMDDDNGLRSSNPRILHIVACIIVALIVNNRIQGRQK
jgi:hypothetical protein